MKELKKWIYRHYKWNLYELIYIWLNSETLEEMVVYKSLYKSDNFPEWQIWIRPKTMFFGKVNIDWDELDRFKYIWN